MLPPFSTRAYYASLPAAAQNRITMVHFEKKQDDELQIIVTDQDIETLRRMIVSSSLMERRTFYGLKEYIETEYKDIIIKQASV